MKNNIESRKRLILTVIAILLSVCLLFLAYRIFGLMDNYFGKLNAVSDDEYGYRHGGQAEYMIDGKWYVQKEKIETYLLIGIDKYESAIKVDNGYRNNQQSDALFLLVIDRENYSYSIIHINRDTMANIRMFDINGIPYNTFEGQLALSHTYGSGLEDSCENTVWSVSDYMFGLDIHHYASFSMDAVPVMNDKIGGVTLTVMDDMTVIDEALIKGNTVTLTGDQALSYVRARGELENSTNIERMKRQRQFVTAFLEQARTAIAADPSVSTEMMKSINEYIVSDLSANELMSLTNVLNNYVFTGINAIEGEARKGEQFMEFYTDEDALKELVLDTFYDLKK